MSTTKYIQLEEDLQDYISTMEKAQQSILDQEISNYPIFVIHQHEIELGVLLVDGPNLGLLWSVHASTLEEFMSKQIIQTDKIDSFKQVYKDTSQFYCCFVLSELGANFIFLPKKRKSTS